MNNPEKASMAEDDHGGLKKLTRLASSKYLKRYVLPSDNHGFIGRIYDLSIVAYSFESYEDLSKHEDCRYVMEVNYYIHLLARRVESLNIAGNMLWPEPFPTAKSLPVSLYAWLVASADVFLTRFISVIDCSLQLVNAVCEGGLSTLDCKMKNFKKIGVSPAIIAVIGSMLDEQASLRSERNARIHNGVERSFTLDDQTFQMAAMFERGRGIRGVDRTGRRINVDRSFREGLVGLQREFNGSTKKLVRQLDELYDLIWEEFEDRFGPRIAAATHGLNAGSRRSQPAELAGND